jgi:hypothetical protein
MSDQIHLYIPFCTEPPWVVRREAIVLSRYESMADARNGAASIARELHSHTHQDVVLQIQSASGQWHADAQSPADAA